MKEPKPIVCVDVHIPHPPRPKPEPVDGVEYCVLFNPVRAHAEAVHRAMHEARVYVFTFWTMNVDAVPDCEWLRAFPRAIPPMWLEPQERGYQAVAAEYVECVLTWMAEGE